MKWLKRLVISILISLTIGAVWAYISDIRFILRYGNGEETLVYYLIYASVYYMVLLIIPVLVVVSIIHSVFWGTTNDGSYGSSYSSGGRGSAVPSGKACPYCGSNNTQHSVSNNNMIFCLSCNDYF